MVCAFTNEARNIPMTIAIKTRGFYKEERNFIYSVDNVEILSKKSVRIVQKFSQYYKVIV